MSTTDQIESLFKHGVVSITIAISPKKTMYIQAGQIVPTGPGTDHMQITHQVDDAPLVEMLNTLAKHVAHANEVKADNLLTLPRGNGR